MGRPANLVVNILGNDQDLKRALGSGGSAVSSFATLAAGAGKAFAAVWTTAAAGAAAVTVSVFKTGVAYNTLNQTAGAAFKTILGSQAASTKMMADLAAFAKTSPFPRQAFIQATQQMLAFGIQSQKVIPYLGAIQDAVAAAGGSSQQLQDVAFVMAQISAAGKITGQDLIQFGQRGINAADLIGQSLGKTGAEIKASITAGTLDAGTALDALAKGMEDRYAGAANLVKQTWAGAKDRIQGAMRDIGSSLAEPFVSKEGGGLGVAWANELADAIRALQPVVDALVTKIMDDFGPTFAAVGQILDGITAKLKGLDASNFTTQLERLAPVLGAITGAAAAMTGGLLSGIPVIGPLLGSLSGPLGLVTAAIAGLIAFSPELQQVFGGAIQGAIKALAPVLPVLSTALKAVSAGLIQVVGAAAPIIPILGQALAGVLAAVAPVLAQLASAILPVFAAALSAIMPAISALVSAFLPLLDLLQPLISALLPPLVQILTLVLSAISPLIPVVTQLVSALVGLVVAAVTPLLPVLKMLLTALLPILQPVLQLVGIFAQLLSALMPLLAPLLQLAGLLLGKLASGIALILTSGLQLIAPIFQGIADALKAVVNWIGQVIAWFAKLKPPAWLSDIGKWLTTPLSAPAPQSSGVSFSAPTGPTATARGLRLGSPLAAAVNTVVSSRPVQVIVQAPYEGDAIARTIRRELVKLDRRERGVVLARVPS